MEVIGQLVAFASLILLGITCLKPGSPKSASEGVGPTKADNGQT
jgi:hypothetical protein